MIVLEAVCLLSMEKDKGGDKIRHLTKEEIDRILKYMFFVCIPCTNKFVYEERCPVANGEYEDKWIVGGEVSVPLDALEFVEFDESDREPSDDNEAMQGYGHLSVCDGNETFYASVKGRCPHCGDSMISAEPE
jgi:hypothetical protein